MIRKFKLLSIKSFSKKKDKTSIFLKIICAIIFIVIEILLNLNQNIAIANETKKNNAKEFSLSSIKNVTKDVKVIVTSVSSTAVLTVGLIKLYQYLMDRNDVCANVERDFVNSEIQICQDSYYRQINPKLKFSSKHIPDILDIAILCNLFKDASDPLYTLNDKWFPSSLKVLKDHFKNVLSDINITLTKNKKKLAVLSFEFFRNVLNNKKSNLLWQPIVNESNGAKDIKGYIKTIACYAAKPISKIILSDMMPKSKIVSNSLSDLINGATKLIVDGMETREKVMSSKFISNIITDIRFNKTNSLTYNQIILRSAILALMEYFYRYPGTDSHTGIDALKKHYIVQDALAQHYMSNSEKIKSEAKLFIKNIADEAIRFWIL